MKTMINSLNIAAPSRKVLLAFNFEDAKQADIKMLEKTIENSENLLKTVDAKSRAAALIKEKIKALEGLKEKIKDLKKEDPNAARTRRQIYEEANAIFNSIKVLALESFGAIKLEGESEIKIPDLPATGAPIAVPPKIAPPILPPAPPPSVEKKTEIDPQEGEEKGPSPAVVEEAPTEDQPSTPTVLASDIPTSPTERSELPAEEGTPSWTPEEPE